MSEEKRPVLLMAGNHTTQPLWKPLSEHFDICLVHPQMAQVMMDLRIPGGFGIHQYMSAEIQENAINIAYKIAAKLHEPSNCDALSYRIDRAFSVAKQGVPSNFLSPYVNEWFPGMLGEHVKNHVVIMGMIDRLLSERKVVGCIVHEDVTPDMRAMVMYCRHRGIPTIHVPHANCFYIGDKWDIHTESISDYILASGEYAKGFYSHWGYLEDKIIITGMPQWDKWYEASLPPKPEARRVLGIPTDDEFVLIYASSWTQTTGMRGRFEDELNDSLGMAIEAAKELPATLCVKMHPGEPQNNEQVYLNAMNAAGTEGFVTRQFAEYVLSAGDVVLAHGPSNFCCQASAVGMPCAYIGTEDFAFPFPGPVAVSWENATHAVRMALQLDKDKTWGVFSKNTNDAHGVGNACERIVGEVRKICLSA